VLDGAEFRHLDQHGERGGLGDAHEDREAGLQGGIGGERGSKAVPLAAIWRSLWRRRSLA
jgi:hypothetical protein